MNSRSWEYTKFLSSIFRTVQRSADASRALEFKNEHAEQRERAFNTQTPYFRRFKGKQLMQAATGRVALAIFESPSSTCNRFTLPKRNFIIYIYIYTYKYTHIKRMEMIKKKIYKRFLFPFSIRTRYINKTLSTMHEKRKEKKRKRIFFLSQIIMLKFICNLSIFLHIY